MGKCKRCGKKSIFLKLYGDGFCSQCFDRLAKEEEEQAAQKNAITINDFLNLRTVTDDMRNSPHLSDKLHESVLEDFIVIDVETTGLSAESDAIIQLAAVHYKDHKEIDSFSTYVNPLCDIPPRITEITGIESSDVADAPVFSAVKKSFLAFIEQAPILTGYNFPFDLRFLSAAAGFEFSEKYKCIDTLALARDRIPSFGYKLSQLCEIIGYSTLYHDALNDCRACGAVLNYICKNTGYRSLLPLRYCSKSNRRHAAKAQGVYSNKQPFNCDFPIHKSDIVDDGLLVGKTIVFTGNLSFTRSTAEDMAQWAGAVVRGSVSKKTNYLVVGMQDEMLVGADGLSSKEKKAHCLSNECGINIQIIDESEYLKLLCHKDMSCDEQFSAT